MIVLAGATSQWKRSEAGSAAIGPAPASPAAIRRTRLEVPADGLDVRVRRERAQAVLVQRDPRPEELPRAAEEHDARVQALAPLDARDDPDDRVLERARPRRASSASAAKARGASSRAVQVGGVLGARARREPLLRHEAEHAVDRAVAEPRAPSARPPRARRPRREGARGCGSSGRGAARRRADPPRRAGGRAPRRGRSATAGRATAAGSGSAASGRRS